MKNSYIIMAGTIFREFKCKLCVIYLYIRKKISTFACFQVPSWTQLYLFKNKIWRLLWVKNHILLTILLKNIISFSIFLFCTKIPTLCTTRLQKLCRGIPPPLHTSATHHGPTLVRSPAKASANRLYLPLTYIVLNNNR